MASDFDKFFEMGEHLAKTGASKDVIVEVLRDKGCSYFMTLTIIGKLKKTYKISISTNKKMLRIVLASRLLLAAIIIGVLLFWFNYAGDTFGYLLPLVIGYGMIWMIYSMIIWIFLSMYPGKGYGNKPNVLTHVLSGLAIAIVCIALWNAWLFLMILLIAIVTFMLLISIYNMGTAEAALITVVLGFLNLLFRWLMPIFLERAATIL